MLAKRSKPGYGDYDDKFWENINCLRRSLIVINNCKKIKPTQDCKNDNGSTSSLKEDNQNFGISSASTVALTRSLLMQKIEETFLNCILAVSQEQPPSITLCNRKSWKNISFNTAYGLQMNADSSRTVIKFSSISSVRKFALILHVLSKLYYLLQTNMYCTKRELYYQDVQLFGTQTVVDTILDDIACLFEVPRTELHVLATSKGCIIGDLQYKDAEGNYIDCSEIANGVLIPSDVNGITYICSEARFILIIEKDATFQKLIDSNITTMLYPCICLTGRGFPDVNTRQMVRKLWDTLQIPILALVDADPYGIEILCVYRYGSMSLAFDTKNLAVPQIRWLGVHPTDIQRLNFPDSAVMPLTENDVDKANSLLLRPYIQYNEEWANQIRTLLSLRKKAEIEGLCKIASNFLSNVYLPSKIRLGGWI